MPDPARLLRTLKQAAQAFRDTPGRKGRMVYPDQAEEVMVLGDLHGSVENFRQALQKAQLETHPKRHLVLQELIHGPFRYAGGGDKSHQLVDLVAALKGQYPKQVHLILGNHELSQSKFQDIAKDEAALNASFREGVAEAYGPHARSIYAAYLDLFAITPLALRTANRVFISHSLPSGSRMERFSLQLIEQDRHDEQEFRPGGAIHALVWGRDTSASTAATFLEKVDADLLITGHIPCPEGFHVPNDRQLILDAQGSPACYCLFPSGRAITHEVLVASVGAL
jgi:hypothetical protein